MKIINNILSKVVVAGLFSFAMFSCSGTGEYLPTSEENSSSQANAYMTINLSGSTSSSSRTQGTPTEDGIETAENKISNLAIALINQSDKSLTLITNPVVSQSGTSASVSPFLMKKGTYKIYLIANYTNDVINELETANNYASLQLVMSKISTFAKEDNFMMTNAVNYMGDESNIPTVEVKAENTMDNAAHPANAIQMDRMAAKIRMKSGMTTTFTVPNFAIRKYDAETNTWSSTSNNQVNLLSYALLNTYQRAYLYQNWSKTTSTFNQLLVTPNSSSDYSAADFANGMDTYSTRTKDTQSTFTSGYSALVDLTRSSDILLGSLTSVAYCLENNSNITEALDYAVNPNVFYTKKQNTTTGVLFRAQLASGATFYSYNGRYYADLASIQAEYNQVFGTSSVADVAAMSVEDIRTHYGVKVYQGGYMYYTHYIYDTNYTDPLAGSATNNHYYAVMRNSIYDMNVTGIKKFGDDIPGGWDYNGDDNIDKKDSYMQVELTVNPWVLNLYTVVLK